MSADLTTYNQDGAYAQARAVLAMLQYVHGGGIEESWSNEWKRYTADVKVGRWENCREQGYVVSLHSEDYSKQINIAWFEHRNSDEICAIKWEQVTINTPSINTIPETEYKNKWDVSFTVGYGEVTKMADWINDELYDFWISTRKPVVEDKNVDISV